MVPFKETINTKQELIEACKKGFEDYSNRLISKNDFCMFFGFTHGEAIIKFYEGNFEQLLIDGGFNTGSGAYFSGGINAWKNLRDGKYVFPPFTQKDSCLIHPKVTNHQQIFYGAPGTGKSNTIKREVDDKGKKCFRTTFHPDSDYSTFVGCYKPSMKPTGVTLASGEREEVITYKFIPQAFTKAYVEAWKNEEDVFLIIEEINRGNCAQIFGDLFQLLDRKNGVSEYPIEADTDLAAYLAEALKDSEREDIPEEIKNGEKLMLPSNLYIWATMNTSDQSLFPIDSAFKRRWDWKYIPIDTRKETWSIVVDKAKYSWTSFLEIVNEYVLKATSSEDKQLGFYFCKAQNNVVSAETFVSKVLFYLWNDVFKDYEEGESVFRDTSGALLPFSKFYKTDGSVNYAMVNELLTALDVEKEQPETQETEEAPEETTTQETA